mmetsp:Transcript_32171/g.73689  ORF Transcript_32171/g.73689 Transcript_32171/m.73689 type:complete len:238 (+) Transcript_32171:313-1026(+)
MCRRKGPGCGRAVSVVGNREKLAAVGGGEGTGGEVSPGRLVRHAGPHQHVLHELRRRGVPLVQLACERVRVSRAAVVVLGSHAEHCVSHVPALPVPRVRGRNQLDECEAAIDLVHCRVLRWGRRASVGHHSVVHAPHREVLPVHGLVRGDGRTTSDGVRVQHSLHNRPPLSARRPHHRRLRPSTVGSRGGLEHDVSVPHVLVKPVYSAGIDDRLLPQDVAQRTGELVVIGIRSTNKH